MSLSNEHRQVQRSVKIYRCDRCRAEGTEDAGVAGWSMLIVLELRAAPTMMGTLVDQLSAKHGADRHFCPTCAIFLHEAMGDSPAPEMVGNDIANIPIRMTGGGTVMLTRYEWERWAAKGKPPVLSEADVKVKS